MPTKTSALVFKSRMTDMSANVSYAGLGFNKPLSVILLLVCTPIFFVNTLTALLKGKPIFECINLKDCLNRKVSYRRFSSGVLKQSAVLWSILTNQLSFCGLPMTLKLSKEQIRQLQKYHHLPTGCFDAVSLHQSSGMKVTSEYRLLEQQFSATPLDYLTLIIRGMLSRVLYSDDNAQTNQPKRFTLFGLKINNDSMQGAVNWVMSPMEQRDEGSRCKVGCFANVNSVNLSFKHQQLKAHINQADRCFADGSGMRIAAKFIGMSVRENVNGTDMLPHICQAASTQGVSIYLLGAKPGVARAAAKNLSKQFPILRIAGADHGYFDVKDSRQVIERVNQSQAGILLLAMGSPHQEKWLVENAHLLHCRTALAVGGLFDFYSGNIPRAPMWMREMGLEWIWRLIQEPKSKFNRYVIGNPLFLIRTFIFNLASKGH